MNREHPSGDDGASPSQLIEINRICDRFEEAWRAGRRPAIEDCLKEMAEPSRPALLRELLATELELRRSVGERPGVAEYRTRFSGHTAVVEAAFERAGLAPTPLAAAANQDPVASHTGWNLLFGLLALQNNFIDRDALLAAFNTGSPTRRGRWGTSCGLGACSTARVTRWWRPWSGSTSSSTAGTRRGAWRPWPSATRPVKRSKKSATPASTPPCRLPARWHPRAATSLQLGGHLFQGRYRTELVEDETYLWVLTRYIHLNPVRAGMVPRPEQWAWSSYPGYAFRRCRFDWVAHEQLLAAWSGEFAAPTLRRRTGAS